MKRNVYIAAVARTPVGSMGSFLASIPATQLGTKAIHAAVERAGIKPGQVEEVFYGNVLSANTGQAPSRQAALGAGISNTVPCTTVNKVCASGAKATMFGIQSILLGDADLVVTGGMESMSNTPFYLDKARFGYKLGNGALVDGILRDGLWDVYNDFHMGNAAELCAEECNISREQQDEYTVQSYQRAAEATAKGYLRDEIVPVEVPGKKESTTVEEDEEYKNIKYDKVGKLKPVFQKDGTVTAANASTINDGAAALVLASEEKVNELGLKPIAKVLSYADAAKEPERFTTAPAESLRKAAAKAGKKLSDIDFFEINEAFAVVPMANNQILDLDPEKVNVFGGAVSLGHPIGCSGARILVTLTSVLKHKGGQIGAIGICNGGGGASSLVIEKV